jgi:transcriptional regulator with XRE-family HTH domain
MTAKPTPGGIWLREQRRALGLTADALGGALGVAGNTIAAVECGDRNLSTKRRARAEAYFAKQHLLEPAGERKLPLDDLVRMAAWVHPWTVTACLREAKKREVNHELVLGEWADRPRQDEEWGLERAIVGALRSAINDHGPITSENMGSAAKRILGNVVNARGPTVRGCFA